MISAVEFLYNLNEKFIFPLLKFSNIYVDDFGILRPMNNPDPSLSYQYEGKELIVVRNNAQFQNIKDKKDEFEMFNPLIVPRHCVFLANVVSMAASKLSYDEDDYDDDLDEYIDENENNEEDETNRNGMIRMFQCKDEETGLNNKIFFSFVDSYGNPKGEVLAEYTNINMIISTLGAVIKLVKRFKKVLFNEFESIEDLINTIIIGLLKYQKLKENEINSKNKITKLSLLDDEEIYDDISGVEKIDFYLDPVLVENPETVYSMFHEKSIERHLDEESVNIKIMNGILLPKYKLITDDKEENVSENIAKSIDLIDFYNVDFL